jgi:F-type H+-transporting ATPase subunit a
MKEWEGKSLILQNLMQNQMMLKKLIGIVDNGDSGFDITSKILARFDVAGQEVWLTQTVVTTWVIMAALIIFAIIVRVKLKNFKDKPEGFQNVIEIGIENMYKLVVTCMTEKYDYFGKWFFGVFCFILCSNLSGLLGFRAPTADLSTTIAVALATFVMIHFMGIYTGKGSYFKSYIEPVPFLLPINLVSEIATPISLSFRLFGNIMGGMVIMSLVYSLPRYLNFGIPAVLHVYFDVFAGCIQTVVFVMLSMTFIKDKIAD